MSKAGWGTKTQQRTIDQVKNNLSSLVKVGRMEPVPVTTFQATSALKTRGAQITFQATSLQGVDSFVLLRNFSRDPGSAQVIHSWTAKSLQTTPQTYPLNLQYMDADPSIAGKVAYYWIKAVPVSNQTEANVFLSGPQKFDASQQPQAGAITGDYPVAQAYTPTSHPLTSTTGGSANHATITIAAFQIQYPFDIDNDGIADLISYSSGSITPLNDSTSYFVYFNDPTYAGGAQSYIASVNNPDLTAGLYRQYIGNILTPAFGGGGTSGQGGGGGAGGAPCFSGNTLIVTKRGMVPICEIKPGDRVYSRYGWKEVRTLLVHDYDGPMQEMGNGQLVTPGHRVRLQSGEWVRAEQVFLVSLAFKGQVYNLGLGGRSRSDDARCYLLENGWYAHNALKV